METKEAMNESVERTDVQTKKKMIFKFIGLGAAGNKAILTLIEKGEVSENDTIIINSTSKDIPAEYKGLSIILSPDNTGCGKERSIAKRYAIQAIKDNKIQIEDKYDSVVLVTSVEGGTGSGSTPILAKYISEVLNKNTHICAFTGFENDVRGLQNTVEFFKEVPDTCDIMTIRNSAFSVQAKGNRLRAEELANYEFVRRMHVLTCNNWLLYENSNMDDTDVYKVINSIGYKTVEYQEFDSALESVDDFNKILKSMIYNSKSWKSAEKGVAQLGVILNIKPESEDAVDYDFKIIEDTYGVAYEKYYHVQYDEGKQFIAFIASGLMRPLKEVEDMYNKYKERSAAVNKNADDFYSKVSGFEENEEDHQFDLASDTKPSISKDDFLKNL